MSSLTGNLISSTYQGLLKTSGSSAISSTLAPITDGLGNNTALSLSTTAGSITGDLIVTGVIQGTATSAISASYLVGAASTGSNTFVGNQTVSGSIIPGGLNYNLGSAANPWKELYISTGSIVFVNNGTVVSTLGSSTNGTQMTGSLSVSSSIKVNNRTVYGDLIQGTLTSTTNGFVSLYANDTSVAIYTSASVVGDQIPVILQHNGINAMDSQVLINTANGIGYPNYPAALVVSGESTGTYGGAIFLGRGQYGEVDWGFLTDETRDLRIGNGNQFWNKNIRFNYSASADNIVFSNNAILPGTANHYNLGSAALPWKEIYVSTGSINFINNGAIVSTLGASTSGTQMTGSLTLSGSIELSPAGGFYKASITAYSGSGYSGAGLQIASTGSQIAIFSTGSTSSAIFLGINPHRVGGLQPQVGDASAVLNTYYNSYGPGSFIIGGPKDGSRGGLLGFHSYGNSEWTISQTASSNNNLIIQVNGYPALQRSELLFKPVDWGANTYNVKINQYGILPEPAESGNTYDLGTYIDAPWYNTYTNNLVLSEQSQPGSPVAGQIYFDTNDSHFYGFNGTTWKQLDN
jgi:hypothetical protein